VSHKEEVLEEDERPGLTGASTQLINIKLLMKLKPYKWQASIFHLAGQDPDLISLFFKNVLWHIFH
jgi:hypothetical protein